MQHLTKNALRGSVAIIRKGVNDIRRDVGAYGVEIPHIPELDGATH